MLQILQISSHEWKVFYGILIQKFRGKNKQTNLQLHLFYLTFKNLYIFNYRIIATQYCVGLYHICPLPLEPLTHLPLHPTSLGCHRALSLSFLHQTSNSQWLSILYMILYIFQCYSLNLSHFLLPQLCSKVCSLCLHLHYGEQYGDF